MRVLLISAYRISGLIGGVSRYTIDLLSEASKIGHKITIVERGSVGAEIIDFSDEIAKRKKGRVRFWFNVPKSLELVHNLFVILTSFLKCMSLLHKSKFDVIICDEIGLSGVVGWILNKIYKLPYILQIFGWPKECTSEQSVETKILSPIRKQIIKSAERVIFPFEGGEECLYRLGAERGKAKLLPLGVSLSRFRREENFRKNARARLGVEDDVFVVGYVGRLSKEKGVEMLMDVISATQSHCGKVKLLAVIAGTGPEEETMREIARLRNLNCIFLGQVKEPEFWFNGMDLALALSQHETFGLAGVEAMACQLPVIATDIPAFRRLINHKQSGYLVKYGEIENCSELISALYRNPDYAKELGKVAHKESKKFSVEQSVRVLFDELDSALSK